MRVRTVLPQSFQDHDADDQINRRTKKQAAMADVDCAYGVKGHRDGAEYCDTNSRLQHKAKRRLVAAMIICRVHHTTYGRRKEWLDLDLGLGKKNFSGNWP